MPKDEAWFRAKIAAIREYEENPGGLYQPNLQIQRIVEVLEGLAGFVPRAEGFTQGAEPDDLLGGEEDPPAGGPGGRGVG
ncbi:MAG: hypothetical protein OXE58_07305 [Acidobacteria bacterium]|nr:hypothetical protein [Acidobacteriota bacterium]